MQQSKEEAARLKKLKNELKRTEDKISQTEERISAIDEEYNNPDIASDTAKLVELHNERTSLSEMLDNYTFVEVPSKYADAVLLAMENVTIKGRKISMEKAKGTGRKKKKKR